MSKLITFNLSSNYIQHKYLADILKQIKKYLPTIYDNNLVKIILFGSQARGEANPQSDIDILIVLKTLARTQRQKEKYYEFISNLSLEYDVLISCIHISEDQYHNENSPLLINIHREGIIL